MQPNSTVLNFAVARMRDAVLADSWWAHQSCISGIFKLHSEEWKQKYIPGFDSIDEYIGTLAKFTNNLDEFISREFLPNLSNLRNAARDHPELVFYQPELPKCVTCGLQAGPIRIIIDYLITIDDFGWRCDILLGPKTQQ